ncbi:DEAD/DEAH box helicase [Skermania piniformis]|uniref:DEAD/DEAH box helicase n=1 Tax=Skermania pinensis TaxID=39122 RepID=A0ABX8S7K5_9ACTN|nr:DEAD/DEAH box helicase [Skermania piniformis]QXQ12992.1 DEAD/DEAH box helicase [Skermania piniformis]
MSELLPLTQAASIRESLLDYLGTTFALADPDTRRALDEFLQDPEHGMFRGPYLRLRLPFRPAADGWRDSLEWYEGPTPYGHQAAAFARLSSYRLSADRPRPRPTLVVTGTGSGKTEAFLYPILDHCRRAKRDGITGTKAIVLYPMNALANDQAARLARLLTEHADLAGVTAALYTGEGGPKRTKVTPDGLITDREVIRDLPPDILLTNYKMLDQLLLRPADADIWARSATSLQYLVLDEFHTYDGAQGTDVSMLLRRLGLTLKSHWPEADPAITADDRARPLGRITPVATSATLGADGDPAAMVDFAHTVFGEEFGADAVITESRLTITEWADAAEARVQAEGWAVGELSPTGMEKLAQAAGAGDPHSVTVATLQALYADGAHIADDDDRIAAVVAGTDPILVDLIRAHPAFQQLIAALATAVPVDEVVRSADAPAAAIDALVTTLSHVRATHGRAAPSVDVHLWIRELTRIDRAVSGAPHFVWGDDGVPLDLDTTAGGPYLPALYCRHCNRSGWGIVLAPTGSDLDDDTAIRRRAARRDDRFRALIHAPREAEEPAAPETSSGVTDSGSGLRWLRIADRRLTVAAPDAAQLAEGGAIPVLLHVSDEAGADSKHDVCPACRQRDGIRFLGSAIATMLSVSLSTLFGTPDLNPREKRALVFTDSVQDAAHRAGFVQARSHTLTLRTLIRHALADGAPTDLATLVHRIIDQAGDAGQRFRILPPDLAERDAFARFWTEPPGGVPPAVLRRVRRRVLLDVQLEFGLRSGVGRTLERTGTAAADVEVPDAVLRACARDALDSDGVQIALDVVDPARSLGWVRGVLQHMRARGAIEHEWFTRFRAEDGNRWWITGGRRRDEGMPGFGRGSSAPGFPVLGGPTADTDLEPIGSARGWYALWTAKALGVSSAQGAVLARLLFARLRSRDVLGDATSPTGARTYHLPVESVVVRTITDLDSAAVALSCTVCRDTVVAGPATVAALSGGPCLVARCDGVLRSHRMADNFYRRMYAANDVRRVVAREHTSLLPDELRLAYENGFKQTDPPPDAPNVLVATPTLEMGIDIGDLSAVLLSSLPRTVASYLQRVGRAGRLTGNSLALAYVTGRGDQLPRFARPETTINGAVRPPATYLDAEEILARQFVASVVDRLARRPTAPHPRTTPDALRSSETGTFLGAVIAEAEQHADTLTEAFLAGFPTLAPGVAARLRDLPRAADGPGTSDLARRCHRAVQEWNRRLELTTRRRAAVQAALPDLRARAESPAAVDDDRRELRTAEATLRLLGRQLATMRSEYWIGALESFGLLPNYTLLDDSVSLAVSVHWLDPQTQEYAHSEFELTRGSAPALRDFAPGSTFYARGFAITIDAVDLGAEGEAIRTWVCCPACGHVRELAPELDGRDVPARCPRCGSPAIADPAQQLPVVELTGVSAVIRREEATIDDAVDERAQERFTLVPAVDIDPAQIGRRWFETGLGLGATRLRRLDIRWINLGRSGTGGATRIFAGVKADAALFRVCRECGKLDTSTGQNRRDEHRPWCSRRTAATEDPANIALARRLSTEGLLLRLPVSITLGDSFAVPSLAAALQLGLRERIGGDPTHLAILPIVEPSLRGDNPTALLLHDLVPGGTGYLADFADPAAVWDVLYRAWQVVSHCPCADEGKLACERCLLPFAAPADLAWTARAAAERHLANLLAGREFGPGEAPVIPDAMSWVITEAEPTDPDDGESHLEQRFRIALRARLDALGATVTEKPGPNGVVWDIGLGAGNRWTLRPQELVLGSRPDFVLTSARGGVPPTAIFTDGWNYHASPAHNRVADDAEKRQNLRDGGYQVIAVTADDVAGTTRPSAMLRRADRAMVLSHFGARITPATLDLAFGTAVDLLIDWVQQPRRENRRALAGVVPILALIAAHQTGGQRTASASTTAAAAAALAGTADPGPGNIMICRSGTFAAAIDGAAGGPSAVSVVLDDAPDRLGDHAKPAWQEWLRWANLLNFGQLPTTITTSSGIGDTAPPAIPAEPDRAGGTALSQAWQAVADATLEVELDLLVQLAAAGVPVPVVGEEVDGIPLDVAWPAVKVVLAVGLDDAEQEQLSVAGWTLCEPDRDQLVTALEAAAPAKGDR